MMPDRFHESPLTGNGRWRNFFEPAAFHSADLLTSGTTIGLIHSAAWVLDAAKKLEVLGSRERDWDSYDGLPLSARARECAFETLKILQTLDLPNPDVVLGSAGSVQFEWRHRGKELEVDLGEGDEPGFVKVHDSGAIEEGTLKQGFGNQLLKLSGWLLYD